MLVSIGDSGSGGVTVSPVVKGTVSREIRPFHPLRG